MFMLCFAVYVVAAAANCVAVDVVRALVVRDGVGVVVALAVAIYLTLYCRVYDVVTIIGYGDVYAIDTAGIDAVCYDVAASDTLYVVIFGCCWCLC